jgi:DNA processing protein
MVRAHENQSIIVTYRHPLYPKNVWFSNNPVPIIYVKGEPEVLAERAAVACVGSRNTADKYADRHAAFAAFAARSGYAVVSGFALGADSIGHRSARDVGGRTVCVMPCGLDRPFPPENRDLWKELSNYPGAAMISEFHFGTAASKLTLRKRNKLIVAAALGVLVSESSAKGGAMNAYRFALEQKKPTATFDEDGTERSSGNKAIVEGSPSGRSFPADHDDEGAWQEWLQGLRSSI